MKVYRTTTTIRGKAYTTFTLSYFANGKRQRRQFSEFSEARLEAQRIAQQKAQGALGAAALSAGDRVALEAALALLAQKEGTGNATVARLVDILRDYTAATEHLPKGATLAECVRFFATKHPSNMPRRTVEEVVTEFIADRVTGGCSPVHLHDLETRLSRQFAPRFQLPIHEVTPQMVQQWIVGLNHQKTGKALSPRSKDNLLRQIASLFNFARRMKYVPAELALEISEIPTPRKQHSPIGIYTPGEMNQILDKTSAEILPALAIAAFAGLRLAEVARLDWREVRIKDRLIVVEANKAKTAARRLVPISDNLAAWLTPFRQAHGPVNPCTERTHNVGNALGDRFERAAAKAKVPWKRNGFRHSYVSYRVAVLKDTPAVALECGNSPAVIFSNYRALASEEEGKAWFAVMPPIPASNVVALPTKTTTANSAENSDGHANPIGLGRRI